MYNLGDKVITPVGKGTIIQVFSVNINRYLINFTPMYLVDVNGTQHMFTESDIRRV